MHEDFTDITELIITIRDQNSMNNEDMSSSQQQSSSNNSNNNNNNSNYSNPYADYQMDESLNSQNYPQEAMSSNQYENRNELYEDDASEQMYAFQEQVEDDFANDIVDQLPSNTNDDDDSVYSDVVQDAFKKYQNEFSKYWTNSDDDTIWDNRFTNEELFDDEEQEELYAQMEECWNYMSQEPSLPNAAQSSIEQQQNASQLNPDATEFKPSWLQTTTTASEQSSK